ncbi:MAG: sugar transferase [Chloroflexi bacterium]|nr:sugar transferase [Chloroflexota bacterium]
MKERRLVLILMDGALVNLAVIFAFAIWSLRGDKELPALIATQSFWFGLLSVLWIVAAWLSGLYDLRVAARVLTTARALAQSLVLVLIAYLAIFFAAPTELPRGIVLYHGLIAIGLIAVWRGLYARLALRRRALIVGAGNGGQLIARALAESASAHYAVIGFIDDDPTKHDQVIGMTRDLSRVIREHNVQEVILAITRDLSDETFRALLAAQELGVALRPMPIVYEEITGRVPVDYIGDNWYVALPLGHASTGSVYPIIKRAFDIVSASLGALLFCIALPFIALALKLDSPGPLFYTQERVGQGGRIFRVQKLRTMVVNAEQNGQAVWATKNDPRVTRVGKFLRKLHVDEFPQFWNILRGEMSAVGPRPERPEFVAQLEQHIPFYRLRHAIKPGMAGWALVNAGYVDSLEIAQLRVEYDLYYIKHQALWLDLWI